MSRPEYRAPVMYVNPVREDNEFYNMLMIDFRCDTDTAGTFFNMHYYKLENGPNGYAGFNSGGSDSHRLIFSIWDDHGVHPEIEYISPWAIEDRLLFSGEGNGKHIITELNWAVGSWYTMCINAISRCGKTFFSQWIRKQGDSNWLLCGVMSLPNTGRRFRSSSLFVETVRKNNEIRECSIKNYLGRRVSNNTWKSWNEYIVSNKYFYYVGNELVSTSNVYKDCKVETDDVPSLVKIRTGGEPYEQQISYGTLPTNPPILITQNTTPYSTPVDAPLIPRFIKSKHSNKYVAPDPSGSNQVIQQATPYYWLFEDSEDGYYHIYTNDKTQALSYNVTGSAVLLMPIYYADHQKWTTRSYVASTSIYITPRLFPNKSLGITNGSTAVGAVITLKAHDITAPDIEFNTIKKFKFKTVKNVNSLKYLAPSGTKIIQRGSMYRWLFIPVDENYYYIVTQDCLHAITISGLNTGDDLAFSLFEPGNSQQMWKIQDAGNDNVYIIPKDASTMAMDIENYSTSANAYAQIETFDSSVNSFKWILTTINEG